MAGDEQGQVVLHDPQYGVGKLLRPQTGFEAIYDGQSIVNPIGIYPDGQPLDPQAGVPGSGIDPDLMNGLPVSPGQTLLLWLPQLTYIASSDPLTVEAYEWVVGWRMRNLRDLRLQRQGYHLPFTRGANDTSGPTPQPRVPLPVAWETLVNDNLRPEPTNAIDSGISTPNVNVSAYKAAALTIRGPLIDTTATEAILQQGIADPAALATSVLPSFMALQIIAKGDEMLMLLRRQNGELTYSFDTGLFPANSDLQVSQVLGDGTGQEFPLEGVYVFRGVDQGTISPRSDAGT